MIQLDSDPRKWPEPYKSRYAERLKANQPIEILANVPSTDRHLQQKAFVESTAKRNVVRAGRRGGKTYGVAIRAVKCFLEGKRVLYAAPTLEQVDRFWTVVTRALEPAIKAKTLRKNESRHLIERTGSESRIRAKTAWNADSLRGDFADELILDEWQLMNEDAWRLVGAPMLIDNNGNATFIYTPPSLHSRSVSKADDPQHAAKLFKKAKLDTSGRWAVFHFGSKENPHIDATAIEELAQDMTALAYRMEIEAEDVDQAPGALWTRQTIEQGRLIESQLPDLERIVVAVDPSVTADGDEAGIMVVGSADGQGYLLADVSKQGSPAQWAETAISAFHYYDADLLVAEANNGGEMVKLTLNTIDPRVPVTLVHASRGKQTRAEPVAALAEHQRLHHIGSFPQLEDELCLWMPGDDSPNRLDALVWGVTALNLFKWSQAPRTRREMVYRAIPDKYKPETLKTSYSSQQEMSVNFQMAQAEKKVQRSGMLVFGPDGELVED